METSKNGDYMDEYSGSTFGQEYSFTVDKPVGAMSISPCGRDVVLASRQGLHVIDLDDPYAPPRHLPHYTPWEVADVQWSPFASRDYWVVSTSNQKALVWNLNMTDARSAVEHYLHAHTRAITDINFSAHHLDILATCAVDSFVHCWDLRHPARPALSFADWFAGATQVKWNRQDPHIIASSHEKIIRIWDDRKGAQPLHSIEAHDTKIYGLDWNRIRKTALITCSLDKTMKFWDYAADTETPERVIETSFPIWRARHTPFGYGVLAMAQRDDNDLHLYRRRAEASEEAIDTPVKSFHGHRAQVKEFLWRCRGSVSPDGTDNREHQLVTWGADHQLRLHPMDEESLSAVGYTKGMKVNAKLHITRANATYKTFHDHPGKAGLGASKSTSSLHKHKHQPTVPADLKSGMTLRGQSGILGGFLDAKTRSTHKQAHGKDLDPITWMKGVKAGKKDLALDQSIDSVGLVDHRGHSGSAEYEDLGQEIAQVGQKFINVKWPIAGVKERHVKIAMSTVWNQKESTYLECRIDFPEDYPFSSAPQLKIEKTALLPNEILEKIEQDVAKIGTAYLRFKSNSLEAIIRYLHGDQNLEDVISWTKLDDDSSSDEDDLDGARDDNDTEFGLGDSGLFEAPDIHAHMPSLKHCGAVWGNNGALVCWFPPKSTPSTLSATFGRGSLLRGTKNLVRRYGQASRSDHSKSKALSVNSIDSYDSELESDSADSEPSSSASSLASRRYYAKDITMIADHVYDGDHFGVSTYGTDRFFDGTLKSGDTGGFDLGITQAKSILNLHDLSDLLPAKVVLAQEYVISGPRASEINSIAATRHSQQDLAQVWTLLSLLLHGNPTGDNANGKKQFDPSKTRSNHNLSQLVDFVKWSSHPFGGRGLIDSLFEYYAGIVDVQTLAVMSCILAERDAAMSNEASATMVERPKPKLSPALRKLHDRGYFSPVKKSALFAPEMTPKTRTASLRGPNRPRQDASPLSSSFGTVINDDSLDSSTGDLSLPRGLDARAVSAKISTSPEWVRPLHKSSTNLANAIMTSINRGPFAMTQSAASSPPTLSFLKKKISPLGSLIPGTGPIADQTRLKAEEVRLDSPKGTGQRPGIGRRPSTSRTPSGMTVTLVNQDKFDDQLIEEQPLLDPSKKHHYRIWIAQYAELLRQWDLPLIRAEVLKCSQRFVDGSIPADANTLQHSNEVLPALNCKECSTSIHPEYSSPTCTNCNNHFSTLCVLCTHPILGLSSPCFTCGHVLHIHCRQEWEDLGPAQECPSGCACICSNPTLPANGTVVDTSSPSTTSTYLTLPSSQRSHSPASTVRGFSLVSPSSGTTTPSTQSIRPAALASLQSLAAQNSVRPRNDSLGSQTPERSSNISRDEKASRLRASKSLISVAGLAGFSGASATAATVRPAHRAQRTISGGSREMLTSAGVSPASASRGAATVRAKSGFRRRGSGTRLAYGHRRSSSRKEEVETREEIDAGSGGFELGLDWADDDSDVEGGIV